MKRYQLVPCWCWPVCNKLDVISERAAQYAAILSSDGQEVVHEAKMYAATVSLCTQCLMQTDLGVKVDVILQGD